MSEDPATRVAIGGGARTPFAKAGTAFKEHSPRGVGNPFSELRSLGLWWNRPPFFSGSDPSIYRLRTARR